MRRMVRMEVPSHSNHEKRVGCPVSAEHPLPTQNVSALWAHGSYSELFWRAIAFQGASSVKTRNGGSEMDTVYRAAAASLVLATILGFLVDPPVIDPVTGELVMAGIVFAGLFALREIGGSLVTTFRTLRAWLDRMNSKREPKE